MEFEIPGNPTAWLEAPGPAPWVEELTSHLGLFRAQSEVPDLAWGTRMPLGRSLVPGSVLDALVVLHHPTREGELLVLGISTAELASIDRVGLEAWTSLNPHRVTDPGRADLHDDPAFVEGLAALPKHQPPVFVDPELRPMPIGLFVVLMLSDAGLAHLQRILPTAFADGFRVSITGPLSPPVHLEQGPSCLVEYGDEVRLVLTPDMVDAFVEWDRPRFRNPLLPDLGLCFLPCTSSAEQPRGIAIVQPGPMPSDILEIVTPAGIHLQTLGYAGEFGGNELVLLGKEVDDLQALAAVIRGNTGHIDHFGPGDTLQSAGRSYEASLETAALSNTIVPLLRMVPLPA